MHTGTFQPNLRRATPERPWPTRTTHGLAVLAVPLFAGCAIMNGPIPAPLVQAHCFTAAPLPAREQPAKVFGGTEPPPGDYEPVAILYAVNDTFDSYRRKSRASFSAKAAALGAEAIIGFRETSLACPSPVGLAVRRVAPGGTFHLSRPVPLVVAMESVHWQDRRGTAFAVGSGFSFTQRIWAPAALALARHGFYAYLREAPVGKVSRLGQPIGVNPDLVMHVTIELVSVQNCPFLESSDLAVRVDLLDAKTRAVVRSGRGRISLAPSSPAMELAAVVTGAVLTRGVILPPLDGFPDSSLAGALSIGIERAVAQFQERSTLPRRLGAKPAEN